ncbi:MAG: anthranilate synthase component I family protein [Bacteroidetes bacterium]|nr:anthranilate synthase component I family protein [Bacteroidota bacterium]
MIFKLETTVKKLLADTITPVNIYLKLRDVFAGSVLLESSDYHGNENSLSFICCEPIASFVLDGTQVAITMPNGEEVVRPVSGNVLKELEGFRDAFSFQPGLSKYPYAGLFGYMAYDSVRFFEKVDIKKNADAIPDIAYKLFRFVIVIDHFTNELYLFENRVQGVQYAGYSVDEVEQLIYSNRFATFKFTTVAEERSALTDEQYLQMVKKGIDHCHRGDVFQIVLSRRFTRPFRGDEFNVYRALRSINPSPYLFFFDFGNFKIFGSSPEAQIQIKNGEAHIYPIAGTFKRTGNDAEDAALAEKLAKDEKENAEHVMLVDLARNDLSRSAGQVQVEVFKEVQYYSHVIHLVSKVSGKLEGGARALQVAADTFPAGTLSGAPKPMALSLINQYEPGPRGFYGGCIGFLGFDGTFNHAIMIRTFMSKNNELVFQAGAGVVAKSTPESELQEVNNKVAALRKAIELAEQI